MTSASLKALLLLVLPVASSSGSSPHAVNVRPAVASRAIAASVLLIEILHPVCMAARQGASTSLRS